MSTPPSRLVPRTSGQRLRLAGCQWTATGDPAANLVTLGEWTARAADAGARLVVHPEAAMASFAGRLDTAAEPLDGRFADGVREVAARHGVTLVNTPGTIDSDYRGEIAVLLVNLGSEPVTIERAERIAQMVIAPVTRAELVPVDVLSSTERGSGGFGSTGR